MISRPILSNEQPRLNVAAGEWNVRRAAAEQAPCASVQTPSSYAATLLMLLRYCIDLQCQDADVARFFRFQQGPFK